MLKKFPDTVPPAQVIAVVGPTATGKTSLGVFLAQQLKTEILSADSQLVYRGLDIGTAKPTDAERQGIVHHMMDCVAPNESYSVACYQQAAVPILEGQLQQGKTPVVVGGTGYYLRALLQEQFVPPAPPNEALRQELHQLADTHGNASLHQRLAQQDPDRAAALHPNDRFRVIRALEIIHTTGQPVPKPDSALPQRYRVLWMGLTYANRDAHRAVIDARIDAMLAQGWLAEVQSLVETYGPDAEALQVAHGYPEWCRYLRGELTFEAALSQIQINIHQYARRQRTWFRRNAAIHWLAVDETTEEERRETVLQEALSFLNS